MNLDIRALNEMPKSHAYVSQMLIIIFKASADGANNTISSA